MKYDIVILGAGISGIGAAILAKKKKYSVFVSDNGKITNENKLILNTLQIPFEENTHSENIILKANKIIKSPGIPNTSTIIQKALKIGIPIVSEIEFAYKFVDKPIIGITGSNGKTTTTSLIWHILKSAGVNVAAVGNIGQSFAKTVADAPADVYVMEISSFQLENIFTFRPDIAILLNITPDHLDRYNYNLEKYAKTKLKITQNQTDKDIFIYNLDDELINVLIKESSIAAQKKSFAIKNRADAYFDEQSNCLVYQDFCFKATNLKLRGKHNIYNALAAIIATKTFGISNNYIYEALSDFQPVEHRLQQVDIINKITFVNDSKATNVDSVFYALDAFSENIILIMGGIDKGNDYNKIKPIVQKKVRAIVALGKDNTPIQQAFRGIVPVYSTNNMSDAVKKAYGLATAGDIVLLSPACASFDLFKNYMDRGWHFIQEVKKLKTQINGAK